jgi:hypothetical protein
MGHRRRSSDRTSVDGARHSDWRGRHAAGRLLGSFAVGCVVVLGTPVVTFVVYASARYWDVTPIKALLFAPIVPPAMPIALVAVIRLILVA